MQALRRRRLVAVGWVLLLAVSAAAAQSPPPAPAASAPPANALPASAQLEGRVVGVTDGDTLTLLVERRPVRIRLAQIDAPEKDQPWGRAAKRALSELTFGRTARVEVVDTDRYGRTVGEVFVGDVHVNQEMVRQGNAWAYTRYSRSLESVELESEARAAGRGLWALPAEQREAPWLWRHRARGSPAPPPGPASSSWSCGERHTCSQMTSCEEARFYLETCGQTRLDGDGDGVPCETLCGPGR